MAVSYIEQRMAYLRELERKKKLKYGFVGQPGTATRKEPAQQTIKQTVTPQPKQQTQQPVTKATQQPSIVSMLQAHGATVQKTATNAGLHPRR